jgi:hypothetical protein
MLLKALSVNHMEAISRLDEYALVVFHFFRRDSPQAVDASLVLSKVSLFNLIHFRIEDRFLVLLGYILLHLIIEIHSSRV